MRVVVLFCVVEKEPDPGTGEVYSGDALEVFERLLVAITPNSEDEDPLTRDGIPDTAFQDLLCEARVVPLVKSLLEESIFKLVKPKLVMAGAAKSRDERNLTVGPYFLRLVKYSFRLMTMMAKEHRGNSKLLYTSLEWVEPLLGFNFEAARLLTEVRTTNPTISHG